MRPLKDEFSVPLDLVDRVWLRRPATVILTPCCFILCFFIVTPKIVKEAYKESKKFFFQCW